MWAPPLLIVPLVAYNVVAFGIAGVPVVPWPAVVASVPLPSGTGWEVTAADVVVLGALALLLGGLVRTGHRGNVALRDLIVLMAVSAVYLLEFLLVPAAATSLFVACGAMSVVETATGFAVALAGSGRKAGK